MTSLRPPLLRVCKGLALLAALMFTLIPALPAQAHMHAPGELAGLSHAHVGNQGVDGEESHRLSDQVDACGCCIASHLSIVPASSSVPVPICVLRGHAIVTDIPGLEDALGERLPDPPKHSA